MKCWASRLYTGSSQMVPQQHLAKLLVPRSGLQFLASLTFGARDSHSDRRDGKFWTEKNLSKKVIFLFFPSRMGRQIRSTSSRYKPASFPGDKSI